MCIEVCDINILRGKVCCAATANDFLLREKLCCYVLGSKSEYV